MCNLRMIRRLAYCILVAGLLQLGSLNTFGEEQNLPDLFPHRPIVLLLNDPHLREELALSSSQAAKIQEFFTQLRERQPDCSGGEDCEKLIAEYKKFEAGLGRDAEALLSAVQAQRFAQITWQLNGALAIPYTVPLIEGLSVTSEQKERMLHETEAYRVAAAAINLTPLDNPTPESVKEIVEKARHLREEAETSVLDCLTDSQRQLLASNLGKPFMGESALFRHWWMSHDTETR